MMKSSQKKIVKLFATLLIISSFIAIYKGSYNISILDLAFGNLEEIQEFVILNIRIPRVILADFVGCSSALSGACRNGGDRRPSDCVRSYGRRGSNRNRSIGRYRYSCGEREGLHKRTKPIAGSPREVGTRL